MKRIILACALVLALCAPAMAGDITVSAAASLTDAMNDAKVAFEKAHPGSTVTLNLASSGALYRQLAQGAPADVFLSANPKWMNKAVEDKIIDPATRVNFAKNALVLAVPKGNPAKVSAAQDLTKASITRIGIGTPETVPAGQYAKGSLTSMGLWDKLTGKYIFAENVRQVLDYLARGEVDCGFVYATDAKSREDGVDVITDMPLEKPVTYPGAVVATSADKPLAQAFMDFLLSDQGQSILGAHGFRRP